MNNLAAGSYRLWGVATDNQSGKATNSITVIVNVRPPGDPAYSDANWSSMGVNGSVIAAVVDGSGNLYIAGYFTISGDVFATNIAKWNGSRWSALGSGMKSNVCTLPVSGSNLYVAGWVTTAGGKASPGLAKARIASAAESITASGSSATI